MPPSTTNELQLSENIGRSDRPRSLAHLASHPVPRQRVYLQINDFLIYLLSHKTVSGIQRVQLGIVEHVLGRPESTTDPEINFVCNPHGEAKLQIIDHDQMADVTAYLTNQDVDHDELKRLVNLALDDAVAIRPRPRDICFFTGAFWANGGNAHLMYVLKQQKVFIGIYYYDVIPISHPEYVERELTNDHSQALSDAQNFVDFGLAISDFTASEVRRFIADNGFPTIPIVPLPLAHRVRDALITDAREHDDAWSDAIASLEHQRYVLCVGTIEVRKNHRYLFDAWKALIAEGVDVPLLVFVGRRGWRVDDLFAQFESTRYLNGRIRILHDLSDEELATLYRNCLFTTFPSLVEGWGLPIGESLSYGKACVASNTTSMPEVGGDLVDYIDPFNLRAGIDTFRRLITDPTALARREAEIRTRFRPRSWDDVGAGVMQALDKIRSGLPPSTGHAFVPQIASGDVFCANKFWRGMNDVDLTIRQRRTRTAMAEGWLPAEQHGAWIDGRKSRLLFKTDVGPNTPVIVYILMLSVFWAEKNSVSLISAEPSDAAEPTRTAEPLKFSTNVPPGVNFPARIVVTTNAQGVIDLSFNVGGPIDPMGHDSRAIRVALVSFSYAAQDDALARIEGLETILLDSQVNLA